MIDPNSILKCGSKSCYELSMLKSKICYPLIHPEMSSIIEDIFQPAEIILFVPIIAYLCFVLLSILTETQGQFHAQHVSSGALFVVSMAMASILVILSLQRFDKKWFCLMNPSMPVYRICSDLNLNCESFKNYTNLGPSITFEINGKFTLPRTNKRP